MSRHTETVNRLKNEAYIALETAEGFTANDKLGKNFRIINAEFQIGKFFGIMEALKIIDLNAYVDIGKSATGRCDDILHFTSQIEK